MATKKKYEKLGDVEHFKFSTSKGDVDITGIIGKKDYNVMGKRGYLRTGITKKQALDIVKKL